MRLEDLLLGPETPGDDAVAVMVGHTEITWADLRGLAIEKAHGLADLAPGTSVAVSLPNGIDAIASWFAVWFRQGVVVPVNPRLTEGEREHILTTVAPAFVIDTDGLHSGEPGPRSFGDDTALVSFTSGTTGPPKPVPLRHTAVLQLMDGVLSSIRSGSSPSGKSETSAETAQPAAPRAPMPNLIPVSLSLWAGIYNVLFAFRVGAPVVLMNAFEPVEFAALVARHNIRSTVLPPAAMVTLTDDERVTGLAPLRLVRSITAPLSPLQARRFRDRFGVTVLNGYGQTELGGEVIGWNAADGRQFGDAKLGSVGRPHRDVELRIAGGGATSAAPGETPPSGPEPDEPTPVGSGDVGDVGEVGELWIRTAATAAAASGTAPPELADRLSGDGYLRTGDIARIDDDGFVWIEGRVSEMVNRGGMKVFPAEVEEVLRLASEVKDAVVVGVPDDRLGEVPWAYVVTTAGPIDIAALDAHCRAHLAPYKVPARFVDVDEIPRNEIGKVQRHRLTPPPL